MLSMSTNESGRGTEPERPRFEPEIIPPGSRSQQRSTAGGDENVFVYVGRDGQPKRVNIKAPGPLTIIMVLLAIALLTAVVLAVVLGALVFIIPIAAAALAGLIAYVYARSFWRRFTGSGGSSRRG